MYNETIDTLLTVAKAPLPLTKLNAEETSSPIFESSGNSASLILQATTPL